MLQPLIKAGNGPNDGIVFKQTFNSILFYFCSRQYFGARKAKTGIGLQSYIVHAYERTPRYRRRRQTVGSIRSLACSVRAVTLIRAYPALSLCEAARPLFSAKVLVRCVGFICTSVCLASVQTSVDSVLQRSSYVVRGYCGLERLA